MRLIDADALPSLFDEEYKKTMKLISEGEDHLDNLAEGFTEAHHVILRQPTIEAEPVRYGRNLRRDYPSLFECSVCHWSDDDTTTGDTSVYNYCPHCGARMEKTNGSLD